MNLFKKLSIIIISGLSIFGTSLLLEQALQMYQNNTLKNHPEALQALVKSAEKENVDAAFLLATSYKDGRAGVIDYTKALKWYTSAAKLGDGDAMLMLGWIYYQGKSSYGVNLEEAKYWFVKAAEMGVDEAIEMLHILNS